MKEIKKFLKSIGLNSKQVSLYIISLQYGPQPASILAKHSNMPRPTVYHELYDLISEGIFTKKIVNNVTKFSAVSPLLLENLINKKVQEAQKIKQTYKKILPNILDLSGEDLKSSNASYYSGVKGLCRMLDDFSAIDETVYYISAHEQMDDRILEYVTSNYLPVSNQHKNKNKIILAENKKSRQYAEIASNAYDEFIFINGDKYRFNLTTAIYSDKVAFWSYKESDLSGVIIKNKNVSEDLKNYFDIIRSYFLIKGNHTDYKKNKYGKNIIRRN